MIKHIICLLLILIMSRGMCQSVNDFKLLEGHSNYEAKFEQKRKVEYLFKNKNAFVKYNPVSLFFGGFLFLYQSTISKQIGAQCPYEVNCSNFCKICIQKYGLVKGVFLTSDRLTRCTRLAAIDINEKVDIRRATDKIIDSPDDYSFKDHGH